MYHLLFSECRYHFLFFECKYLSVPGLCALLRDSRFPELFIDCHVHVDVCTYSTCDFLTVVVDKVECRELVILYGV